MGKVSDYIAQRRKKESGLRIGSLRDIADAQRFPPISTGNVVLDYVTSIGGIPRGLVTEIRGETGCLAPDTLIGVYVDGSYQELPISKLVDMWEDPVGWGTESVEVASVDEELQVTRTKLTDAWPSGVKKVYTLQVKSGSTITASGEHPFYTDRGWKKVDDIELGDILYTNNNGDTAVADEVILKDYVGEMDTYDLEVAEGPRNYIANGFVVHNSGKTTAAVQSAVQHQRRVQAGEDTGAVLYLDFEYAVNDEYFRNLGLDVDDEETFIYYQPDTLEEGMQFALDMVKNDLLGMIIVDSIAAASAEAEYDAHIGKLSIGQKAKAINQSLRMMVGPLRVKGVALIMINHTQVKIPQTFMEKKMASNGVQEKVSPGGRAIEYYTSLRLDLSKPSLNKTETHDDLTNEKSKQVTSTEVEAYAFKNKLGNPHRKGKMRVHFGRGFSQVYSAFNILVDHKIIKKKSGGHYEFPDELLPGDVKVPVGEGNVVNAIESNSEWADKIVECAQQLVLKKQVTPTETSVVIDPDTGEVLEDE